MILAARRINRPGTPSPAGIGLHRRRSPAVSLTLANRPELLPLSSLCLLPYYSLPAARLPNNHASLVGRQRYTERIKRMMQRPAQRTAERKAAYTASPQCTVAPLSIARTVDRKRRTNRFTSAAVFLPNCLPKNRPAGQFRSSLISPHRHPAMDESCRKGQSRRKLRANHPAPRSMAAEIADSIEKYGRPFRARSEVLRFTPDL